MKISEIELFVYDFDGVMTDNKVIVDQYGNESVVVNRGDGLAISCFEKKKIPQLILSTETNPVVQKRADKLKIECLHGIESKKDALVQYLNEKEIDNNNVLYVGNDLNDLEVMEFVGIPIAPADADKRVKSISKIVTKAKGGDGVIRELLDIFEMD